MHIIKTSEGYFLLGEKVDVLDTTAPETVGVANTVPTDTIKLITIPVSSKIQKMKLKDLELGKRLLKKKDNSRFVGDIDWDAKVGIDKITIEKGNHKKDGKPIIYISARDSKTHCEKLGAKLPTIQDYLILGEVIKETMGVEYIDFEGYKCDSRSTGYEKYRKLVQDIDNKSGTSFGEYTEDGYILRNRGLYTDKDGAEMAFIRGSRAGNGCAGGVCYLNLNYDTGVEDSSVGVRACL